MNQDYSHELWVIRDYAVAEAHGWTAFVGKFLAIDQAIFLYWIGRA